MGGGMVMGLLCWAVADDPLCLPAFGCEVLMYFDWVGCWFVVEEA